MLRNKRGYHTYTLSALAVFAGIVITSSVAASEVNYSYLKIHYLKADTGVDEFEDATGFDIGGSFQIDPSFYVFGDLKKLKSHGSVTRKDEKAQGDIDAQIIEFGLGYIHPISNQWDVNISGSFIKTKAESMVNYELPGISGISDPISYSLPVSSNDSGFAFKGGLRGMISPDFEAHAFINYDDVTNNGTYTSLGINIFLTQNVSLGGDIEFGDTKISAGLKVYF